MPFVLVATPGSASANSYVDVATADLYFGGRLNADAWFALTDPLIKAAALATATARLDQSRFIGMQTTGAQRLQWPRYGVPSVSGYGWENPNGIPNRIQDAVCELALYLVNQTGTDVLMEQGTESLSRLYAGNVSLFFRGAEAPAGMLPAQVTRITRDLMESMVVRLVRG